MCASCPAHTLYDLNRAACTLCPPEKPFLNGQRCTECENGTFYNRTTFLCERCSTGRAYNPDTDLCECIDRSLFFNGSLCTECNHPRYFDYADLRCKLCTDNQIYSLRDKKCVPCPDETPYFDGN